MSLVLCNGIGVTALLNRIRVISLCNTVRVTAINFIIEYNSYKVTREPVHTLVEWSLGDSFLAPRDSPGTSQSSVKHATVSLDQGAPIPFISL